MSDSNPILLFDGECKFCNFWISFIKKRKKDTEFVYMPLQSNEGKILLKKHKVNEKLDSVIVLKNNRVYSKSGAALAIVNELGGGWNTMKLAYLIPKFIRDWIYDLVAKNRHRFFNTKSNCELHK